MYDLRLSPEQFWRSTPRQFHLLWERHREALLHRELTHAYTSAALYNLLGSPDEPIPETAFMPNYRKSVSPDPAGEPIPDAAMDAYQAQRAHVAALLQSYRETGIADPQLAALGLVKAHG